MEKLRREKYGKGKPEAGGFCRIFRRNAEKNQKILDFLTKPSCQTTKAVV